MRQPTSDPNAKKFVHYLRGRYPIDDKEIPEILSSLKRLVKVVQKIITEPQAQISYPERKEKGGTIKTRLIKTDIEEFTKALGNKPTQFGYTEFKNFMNLFKEDGGK